MGVNESKSIKKDDSINTSQLKIEKNNNNNPNLNKLRKLNEALIPGNANYIDFNTFEKIKYQKENNICKIFKNDQAIGTGFFCDIPGEYKTRKALITAYHVLGDDYLKIGNEIQISINDNKKLNKIKIDNKRRIYGSEEFDITIIEILNKDGLFKNNLLEIDEKIFNNDINLNNEYTNKSIYILHFPKGRFSSFSDNIIIKIDKDNIIQHLCSTEGGSSGSPILDLQSLKVIGIHQGADISRKFNYGLIIKDPIINFNKENKISLIIKNPYHYIGEKIYFFGHDYNDIYYDKINNKNAILKINGEICKFKNNFIPKKYGEYKVEIILNELIDNCDYMFANCNDIISIDLSSFNSLNVKSMGNMFANCIELSDLNLSSFNTTNVKDMKYMFFLCLKLNNLNLSSFNTTNVEDMRSMFEKCYELNDLNLSSFNTTNVKDMSRMFHSCAKLKSLDLSSFNTVNVKNMNSMFSLCLNLKLDKLNMSLNNFKEKFKLYCEYVSSGGSLWDYI